MATQGKIRIYKRTAKKGITYSYSIETGRDPITGKRKRVSKSGFKTAKEALKKLELLHNLYLINYYLGKM